MTGLRCWSFAELARHDYVVIGSGGFAQILLNELQQRHIRPPVAVLEANNPELAGTAPDYLVLGTDTFQLEIIERWAPYLKPSQQFIDVSDIVLCAKFAVKPAVDSRDWQGSTDILFCGIGTAVSEALWLYPVRHLLAEARLGWRCVHPLDEQRNNLIKQAKAVIIWNGSQKIYQDFLLQCRQNNVPVTYAECGFFPQAEHFYFDKIGVNLASQLKTDDLSWLTADDVELTECYRRQLFQERHKQDRGYVFVPLQIGSDSNIQNHSRFVNGMQSYIDFVLSQHPADKVIFKVHPKDQYASHYQFYAATVSTDDTLDLIAAAALVRGINSSVLFEAALFGKPVKADGDSLLNQNKAGAGNIVTAIIARQYRTTAFAINQPKLGRFSNLGHLLYD